MGLDFSVLETVLIEIAKKFGFLNVYDEVYPLFMKLLWSDIE